MRRQSGVKPPHQRVRQTGPNSGGRPGKADPHSTGFELAGVGLESPTYLRVTPSHAIIRQASSCVSSDSAEGVAELGQALGDTGFRIFLALEFEGYKALVADVGQDLRNAPVVQIQGIPFPAPK